MDVVGFAGSRSGALISSAWASLMHMGRQGYLDVTQHIMQVRGVSLLAAQRHGRC